jgi:CBS domain-containing protein
LGTALTKPGTPKALLAAERLTTLRRTADDDDPVERVIVSNAEQLVIVTALFPAERRGRALGAMATVVALGLTLGPPLGGLIVEELSWRWIFLPNLPIGALAAVWAGRALPDERPERAAPLDRAGALLLAVALGAGVGAIEQSSAGGALPVALAGLAVAAGALLAVHLRRVPVPILDADNTLRGIISERDLIRNSVIKDSVGVSDFSNGTDDDEWTWESIRDNHTLSYSISKVQIPKKPVKSAMVKNVIAVPLNAEVSECALKMKRARVDQLPVINGDKRLVAMLFDRDLIRVLCTPTAT